MQSAYLIRDAYMDRYRLFHISSEQITRWRTCAMTYDTGIYYGSLLLRQNRRR